MESACFLAFDLGATSGRAMLGTLSRGRLSLEEVHRFPNRIVSKDGHLHWDFDALYGEILNGLKRAFATGADIRSVGIDTWGVDVAFFDGEGELVAQPYCYRDPGFTGASGRFFAEQMDRERLYARTGIQVLDFNTLFQLDSLRRRGSRELSRAAHILFLPDALTYRLTGRMVTEYTIASTSHLLDPLQRRFDPELLSAVGIAPGRFAPMVQPGTVTGVLRADIARECGVPQVPVVSVAGHDTASAVAAVP
ncbi:MAG: rhamnulokinase, partial [Bacteroidales bacterium]|nr:rhamnulokinase [Bacteroidales bacterium]